MPVHYRSFVLVAVTHLLKIILLSIGILVLLRLPQLWQPVPSSTSPQKKTNPNPTISLTIAATGDLHGWISNQLFFPKQKKVHGVFHLLPMIHALRKNHPELILLDAGDTLQGDPIMHYHHLFPQQGKILPIIHYMNQMKYDAIVLGNHDFDPPQNILAQAIKDSNFTWLSANYLTQQLPLQPYLVIERKGIRIGVLGLTTTGTPMWSDAEKLRHIEIQDFWESANYWSTILKEKEKVDLLIGLFHSGDYSQYDQKIALSQGIATPNASGELADFSSIFDLIIAGHSHRTFPIRATNLLLSHPTPVVQPGSKGEGINVTKLELMQEKNRWKIQKITSSFQRTSAKMGNQSIAHLQREFQPVIHYFQRPTQVFWSGSSIRDTFYQCTTDISHQSILLHQPSPAISLLPNLWRIKKTKPELQKNDVITYSHLYQWLPYENYLVLAQLSLAQVETLLTPYHRYLAGKYYRYNQLLFLGGTTDLPPTPASGEWSFFKKNQVPTWITNYHWNGGGGLRGKVLFDQQQKQSQTELSLRTLIFQYLSNTNELPQSCQTYFHLRRS